MSKPGHCVGLAGCLWADNGGRPPENHHGITECAACNPPHAIRNGGSNPRRVNGINPITGLYDYLGMKINGELVYKASIREHLTSVVSMFEPDLVSQGVEEVLKG